MPLPLDAAHPKADIVGEKGSETGRGAGGSRGAPGGLKLKKLARAHIGIDAVPYHFVLPLERASRPLCPRPPVCELGDVRTHLKLFCFTF